MESLASYGSDDDQDLDMLQQNVMGRARDSGNGRSGRRGHEDNYENVGMDMSDEESNNNSSPRPEEHRSSRQHQSTRIRRSGEKDLSSPPPTTSRSDDKSKLKYSRKSSSDDYHRRRSKSRSPPVRNHKRSRSPKVDSNDRDRDRYERRNAITETLSSNSSNRSYSDKKRSRSRDRKRSLSKERSSGYRKNSRSPPSSRHNRRRSRSRDRRDRSRSPPPSSTRYGDSRYKSRYDRTSSKLAVLEKLGIEIKTPDCQFVTPHMLMQKSMNDKVEEVKNATGIELPKYYNPAVMNPSRYAEQIQKRRLLWGNKNKAVNVPVDAVDMTSGTALPSAMSTTTAPSNLVPKIWGQTKFNHDNDGKVASKFKRLMGIKDDVEPAAGKELTSSDTLRKQEEMFHSMEAQYEVARAATHTMRGVGLGFGAFTGNFPR